MSIFTPHSQKPQAVIHVDLDGARHIYRHHGWPYPYQDDPLFESGMKNLLTFLQQNQVTATLFTIAEDLEDEHKRPLLQQAVAQGHEIASHSLTHPEFDKLNPQQKWHEIAQSRSLLADSLQTEVNGFRTPNYQIDRHSFELIHKAGYTYDSSVFPTHKWAERLQVAALPQTPHHPVQSCDVWQLPLPDYKPAPLPFHPSYSLLLGTPYFQWGLRRFRRTRQPFIFLLHLTDFSDPLPTDRLPNWQAKIYTLSHLTAVQKMARCQTMINKVKKEYTMTNTNDLLAQQTSTAANNQPLLLAISTTHETGASLFRGTELLAAISEERMDRVKLSTKYPPIGSIKECIRISGVNPADIHNVVISGLPVGKLSFKLLKGQFKDFIDFHSLNDYFPHFNKALYRYFYLFRAMGYGAVTSFLKREYGIAPEMHFVEHHLCHAASAYRTAPFDEALIVTADGVGDDISMTISVGRNGRIERLLEVPYPHSFGQFYTACTQMLGFRGGRHEGKITGLSGFGKVDPNLYEKIKATIWSHGPKFKLHKKYYSEGIIRGLSLTKIRRGEDMFDAVSYRNYKAPLKELIANHSREDVAAVFQKLLEEEVAKVVRPFAEQTGIKNLALAGGVFANVKLNHTLFRDLNMEQVYIFPAMGDGGLSVGAALEHIEATPTPFVTPCWGPEYSEAEMEAALKAAHSQGLRYQREDNLEKTVAEKLAEKKVVARFNGRMEFGPRALCNRSILYSAADRDANTWLNKRLNRTEFMPFAPVAKTDKADMLFTDMSGKEHALKFMTIIVDCTDFTIENCPAIVHVDGTARPQLVTPDSNPSMYKILDYYEEITGVPLMVNTSFNMHEEPIVCSPDDAVRGYLDSRLDHLAMGPFLAWIEG